MSNIEWTDETWNPVTGCTRASAGCDNCYAVKMTHRLESMGQQKYTGLTVLNGKQDRHFNGQVRCHEDALEIPLRWRKPRMVFVNSMSDLFHPDVAFEFIDKVFAVMALCPQHTFQVLTKRPDRMAGYLLKPDRQPHPHAVDQINQCSTDDRIDIERDCVRIPVKKPGDHWSQAARVNVMPWPLPNVWIGTSVENQDAADERIPHLLRCPAAVRFLSLEPLLGPMNLRKGVYLMPPTCSGDRPDEYGTTLDGIDWLIIGGESGHGARPCDISWIRDIINQADSAGVSVFVKQVGSRPYEIADNGSAVRSWGEAKVQRNGDFVQIHLQDKKGDMNEWPEDLRRREFPKVGVTHA